MAYTAWQASTAYSVNTVVRSSTQLGAGLVFICTVAGTSGTTEPGWPTTINSDVPDNTVTWQAVSSTAADLQAVAPSSIIELFQLHLNVLQHGVDQIYYFHAGTNNVNEGEIVWNGQAYLRLPIEADGFAYEGTGQLPRPKLVVSNILGTISSLLLTLPDGLEGAKVARIRTLAKYLDAVNFVGGTNATADSAAEWPREIYYIDRRSAENREVVEFELAAAFDLVNVYAPKRLCLSSICQWVYRGTECGYTGTNYFDATDQSVPNASQDVCGKRLTSCEKRFGTNAELPYGSFPGIGQYYS